ncbi:MAG: hypothetical protein ACT4NY_09495 [Pseudonocardiales bacterium]
MTAPRSFAEPGSELGPQLGHRDCVGTGDPLACLDFDAEDLATAQL